MGNMSDKQFYAVWVFLVLMAFLPMIVGGVAIFCDCLK